MDQNLKENLIDGEKVRWTGRPASVNLLKCPSRNFILLSWIASAVIIAAALSTLIPYYIQTQRTATDMAVIVVVVCFLPLLISLRPILDKRTLEHHMLYAITDHRFIVASKDDVMYIPITADLKMSADQWDSTRGNLYIGDAVGIRPGKHLVTAIMGLRPEGPTSPLVRGLLFYNVEDPHALLSYIS